jgi:hypothetical protein
MKICPQCRNTYTDDNLKYCLQDGTPLVGQGASQSDWGEAETIVSPKAPAQVTWQNPSTQNPSAPDWSNVTNPQTEIPPAEKSRTGLIVALTAMITLIVIGGAVAGYLFFGRDRKVEVAQNTANNSKPANTNANLKTNNSVVNANSNTNVNANSNTNANSSWTTPTAKPTLDPDEKEEIRGDVKNVIEYWESSVTDHDLDGHLANYAPTVDYYNGGKVSVAKVRADREKAFTKYDNLKNKITNLKIIPDETGEKAIAVFDKEWDFSTSETFNTGKVQQQLTLGKINGEWLITGEKDLKVYYKN